MARLVLAPSITLNSGHKMPSLGFGTASRPPPPPEQLKSFLIDAVESGFRHLDTATSYGTESTVGEAMSKALDLGTLKDRDEIFVTSKLFITDTQRHLVLPALRRTLDKLGLEYVDLYLIHWPMTMKQSAAAKYPFKLSGEDMLRFDVKQVWEAMEECCKLGLAKSIGVSNFSCAKLSKLLEFASVVPAVNQVEMNVAWQQDKLLDFCKEKNIHVCAYSPLGANGTPWGSNSVIESPILKEIAYAKRKSVAQVALRWIYEQGVTPIVKSFNKDRMRQNLQIFDWELTDEERGKIRSIPQRRIVRGENFVFPEGQYTSVQELWDGEV